jgi:hypothetical protein
MNSPNERDGVQFQESHDYATSVQFQESQDYDTIQASTWLYQTHLKP